MKNINVKAMPYENMGTYRPAWAASKAKNAAKLKEQMKSAISYATYTGTGVDVVVYKAKDGIADFYFVSGAVGDDSELIQYGVRVIHYGLSGRVTSKSCGQVSVWLNAGYWPTCKLPEWLFTHVLYPVYGYILTDRAPFSLGQPFWGRRIMEALHAGRKVFAIECEEVGTKIKVEEIYPVRSVADMDKYYTRGTNYGGAFFRFAIKYAPLP
jgi:hypothetical protein